MLLLMDNTCICVHNCVVTKTGLWFSVTLVALRLKGFCFHCHDAGGTSYTMCGSSFLHLPFYTGGGLFQGSFSCIVHVHTHVYAMSFVVSHVIRELCAFIREHHLHVGLRMCQERCKQVVSIHED